jgi:hypothetical protein
MSVRARLVGGIVATQRVPYEGLCGEKCLHICVATRIAGAAAHGNSGFMARHARISGDPYMAV